MTKGIHAPGGVLDFEIYPIATIKPGTRESGLVNQWTKMVNNHPTLCLLCNHEWNRYNVFHDFPVRFALLIPLIFPKNPRAFTTAICRRCNEKDNVNTLIAEKIKKAFPGSWTQDIKETKQ
jgi:hypothetical protein